MATTKQILEQPNFPFIQRTKSWRTIISINGSPMNNDKEEEFSRSSLALFKAKEDEIERWQMEIRDRVQIKLGLAEGATKRLAERQISRKEVSAIRKRVDAINRELKPLRDEVKHSASVCLFCFNDRWFLINFFGI